MRKRSTALALSAGLLLAAGAWLLHPRAPNAPSPASRPSLDAAHEKIFLSEQLKRNPTHGPILLRLAQIERSEGNLAGARRHLEEALLGDPRQVDIRLELGLVYSEIGDLAAAEEQNRTVLRQDPKQPDALYNLGALAANRGDLGQARKLWAEAARNGAANAASALAQLEAARR